MRTLTAPFIASVLTPRKVSARLTSRRRKHIFSNTTIYDSLGLSDPSTIDSALYSTGIYRVVNSLDYLYTQSILDLSDLVTLDPWQNRGIALKPGSRPGVEGDRVWYQVTNGDIYYSNISDDFATQTFVSSYFSAFVCSLAPVASGVYVYYLDGDWGALQYMNTTGGRTVWKGRIYGDIQTSQFVDAVVTGAIHYIYLMDRNAGRVLELRRSGTNWSASQYVVPIDAVDNVTGLTLASATVINGRIVLSGRMVKSSDGTPISMDVMLIGPGVYTFGRYAFLSSQSIGGKVFLIDGVTYYVGANNVSSSPATIMLGYDNPDYKAVVEDVVNLNITEAELQAGTLSAYLAHDVSEIAEGDDVVVEMAYNDVWVQLMRASIENANRSGSFEGEGISIEGATYSIGALSRYVPQQSYYINSQVKVNDHPGEFVNYVVAKGETDTSLTTKILSVPVLNEETVIYSAGAATRHGIMRAKFLYPTGDFYPSYGVAVNYYLESTYDAALRLGIPQKKIKNEAGSNGIVARYGASEHSGNPGIGLYLWDADVFTKLTSASLTIPAATWHWLQISFMDGQVSVSYRLDASTEWVEKINHTYVDQTRTPWKRETFGRGAIYINNITLGSTSYGFYSTDMIIPVDEVSNFPTSETIIVDKEQITYNGKSTDFTPTDELTVGKIGDYRAGGGTFVGEQLAITGADNSHADGFYNGAALVVTSGAGEGKAVKITGYDAVAPQKWAPTGTYTPPDTWQDHIGQTGYGSWVASNQRRIFTEQKLDGIITEGSKVKIVSGLYVVARGVDDTSATTHDVGNAYLYRDLSVSCDWADNFSGDVDMCLEDALKIIAVSSGANAVFKSILDESVVIASNWGVSTWNSELENLVCDFTIPTMSAGDGIGLVWRTATKSSGSPTSAGPKITSGYMATLDLTGSDYYVTFHLCTAGVWSEVEKVKLNFTPAQNMRISVQGTTVSVWIMDFLVASFYDGTYQSGQYAAVVSRTAKTIAARIPELIEYVEVFTMDNKTSAISALTSLIGDRRIFYSDDDDGNLRFYRKYTDAGRIPDIIFNYSESLSDNKVSWVRTEGIKVTEKINLASLKANGILFKVNNASYANSVVDTNRAGSYFLVNENARASTYSFDTALHPLFQPGDYAIFELPIGDKTIDIQSTAINIGVSEGKVVCTESMGGIIHG